MSDDEITAERLPDEAIVLRGGVNDRERMKEQAEAEFRDGSGVYALSGASEVSWTLEQIAMANKRRNRQIRKTTVGRLRAVHCEVLPPTGRNKHVDILLPQPPTEADWDAFEGAWDLAEPNPYRRWLDERA